MCQLTSTVPVVARQNEAREAATHEGTLCIGAVLLTIVSHHHTLINICRECGAKQYEAIHNKIHNICEGNTCILKNVRLKNREAIAKICSLHSTCQRYSNSQSKMPYIAKCLQSIKLATFTNGPNLRIFILQTFLYIRSNRHRAIIICTMTS